MSKLKHRQGAKPPDLQGSGKGALGITSLGGRISPCSCEPGNPVVAKKKICSKYDGLEKCLQLLDEKDIFCLLNDMNGSDHFPFTCSPLCQDLQLVHVG